MGNMHINTIIYQLRSNAWQNKMLIAEYDIYLNIGIQDLWHHICFLIYFFFVEMPLILGNIFLFCKFIAGVLSDTMTQVIPAAWFGLTFS